MKRALLTSLVALVFPLATVQAQDPPLWRYTTTEKIDFYLVTPLGDLIVGTKEEVAVLDPETGEVLWRRDDILKKPGGLVINPGGPGSFPGAALDPIPFSPFGVVRTKDGIAMIDLGTGETMWDSTAVPLKKVRGHLIVPQHKMVLVYGETSESKRTLVAVDVATGAVGWRQDTLFRKSPKLQRINSLRSLAGNQHPIVDSDTTFIMNISKDGPMRIHSRTGELLWRLDLNKNPPLLREGYPPMLYDDGVLFVPYDKKLLAVNVTDGSVIWSRKDNFRSRLTQMELTSYGLVVRGRKPAEPEKELFDKPAKPATDFFLDLVDPQTGTSIWERPFTDFRINTPFVADTDAIFIFRRLGFVALDYVDDSWWLLYNFNVTEGETPPTAELAGTNFFLSSSQNFASVNRVGTVQYHRYYEPPGMSLFERVAFAAGLTGMAEMIKDCREGHDPNRFTCGWEFAEHPDSVFYRARFTDAQNSANFAYVYTKQPDYSSGREGFSLVRLDKRNGEEVGRVWIDERRPDFVLDPISGFVFVKQDDKEIFALKFPDI